MEDANRYFIMMTDRVETEVFASEEEYKSFLSNYAKNNKNPKNRYVYGNLKNIQSEKSARVVKYNVYKKITKAYPLLDLDNFLTKQVDNEENLRLRFKSDVEDGKGKVYIGYMFKGQAKTLPIFYKKDRTYVDYEGLKKLMTDNILAPTFLAKVWTNKKLNDNEYRKKIDFYLEKIQVEYGKYVMKKVDNTDGIKRAVSYFVEAWCTKDGKINQRYVRELGSIIKNIEGNNVKEELKKESIEIKGKKEEVKTKKRKKNDTEGMIPLF